MRNHWMLRLLAVLFSFTLLATACGDDSSDDADGGDTDSGDTDGGDTDTGDTGGDDDDTVDLVQDEGQTIQTIIDRGVLNCGVNGQLLGFSNVDADGNYTGLDVDYCRAIAAALLDDPDAVEYTDLTAETRFTALQSGEIDVLIRNGTWTSSRDGALGLQWAATTFYDGAGMLVNADSGFTEVADMDGTIICVQTGTTTEINLEIYFSNLGISYEPLNVADEAAVTSNFSSGACDGYVTDKSGLASFAATYDGDVTILDDTMSKEPLGPATREGDDDFFDVVQWVVFATFNAEEFGLTSENIGDVTPGENGAIDKFVNDAESGLGFPTADWAVRVIEAVGNYQEIYDRNIAPLGIPEGYNQLYTQGGILYGAPVN
ncbi:MAG: amino acid ABC transporter substrate-binding protein [Acidimicrobiales bacterium]